MLIREGEKVGCFLSMKGEGKMAMRSKIKWVGLVGLVLSAFSLFVHFLLARFTEEGIAEYQSSITIFSWRPIFENNVDFAKTVLSTLPSCLSMLFKYLFLLLLWILSVSLLGSL